MTPPDPAAFGRFVVQCAPDLRRVARGTQGEQQLDDVVSEAWMLASCGATHRAAAKKGIHPDIECPAFQQLLLAHLYQALVRYTELHVRHAVRLDHAAPGSEQSDDCHPLMRTIVSDDGRDPLALLIAHETASMNEFDVDLHSSLAGAYVHLLRRFGNAMQAVAEHLMISLSYAYQRCAHARLLAVHQCALPLSSPHASFTPGPWRHFKLIRPHLQLPLDFDHDLSFAATGGESAIEL